MAVASATAERIHEADTAFPGPAIVLVAQAYVACVVGGLRYFTRAGFSWAMYGRLLAQQLAALGPGRRSHSVRLLLDESAAQLREIGDLTVQEALALQKVLRELAEELRELDTETLAEPRRYARAKP